MITIRNNGAIVLSTSYWRTEHARQGLLYLSINAATLRLLVPAATLALLEDLPPVGTPCEITRAVLDGRETYQLAWLDDPTQPYVVELDRRQCDRRLPVAEDGRVLELRCYVHGDGTDGVREVRREPIQIGAEIAS